MFSVRRQVAALALSLFCLASRPMLASAFQNGSFEANNPLSPSPDFSTVPIGWVKNDPTGAGLFLESYSTFGLPTLNGDGLTAFGFGGNGATTGSLSQTFDTVAGTAYTVAFQYAIQQALLPESFQVDALDGATTLSTTQFLHFSNLDWAFGSLNFTAASAQTTLIFTDLSGAQDGTNLFVNWALDGVSVSGQTVGAVPEPGTMALVGIFLAAIAGLKFRRRSLSR